MPSNPATEDELKYFHSSAFVEFMTKVNDSIDLDVSVEEEVEFGIGYDCPLISRQYDLICALAGGSLTGAKLLIQGSCNVAINWFGGWHHAQR